MAALLGLALLFAGYSMPQTAGGADQNTPEALNATYDQAMRAKDWASALTAAQKLVNSNASTENLLLLADVQVSSGAGEAALATTDRALDAVKKEKFTEDPQDAERKELKSKIYLTRGDAFRQLRRNKEAIDTYNRAAPLASNPGLPLLDICVTYANSGDPQDAMPACRKAARADPMRADVWFLLGSLLYGDATVDGNGHLVLTEECREALKKYLDLAPDGSHAADTKSMLQMTQ
jgi:tetratricopeptide (TPR) repeat protein